MNEKLMPTTEKWPMLVSYTLRQSRTTVSRPPPPAAVEAAEANTAWKSSGARWTPACAGSALPLARSPSVTSSWGTDGGLESGGQAQQGGAEANNRRRTPPPTHLAFPHREGVETGLMYSLGRHHTAPRGQLEVNVPASEQRVQAHGGDVRMQCLHGAADGHVDTICNTISIQPLSCT